MDCEKFCFTILVFYNSHINHFANLLNYQSQVMHHMIRKNLCKLEHSVKARCSTGVRYQIYYPLLGMPQILRLSHQMEQGCHCCFSKNTLWLPYCMNRKGSSYSSCIQPSTKMNWVLKKQKPHHFHCSHKHHQSNQLVEIFWKCIYVFQ